MNKMENEYIQLPPLKRDTDLRVIMALWEYVRLSDEVISELPLKN